MIDKLVTGMRVRWIENPNFDLERMKPGMLVGPQKGEITRIKRNRRTGVAAVCVKNQDGQHFHWIEAEAACELLSVAHY